MKEPLRISILFPLLAVVIIIVFAGGLGITFMFLESLHWQVADVPLGVVGPRNGARGRSAHGGRVFADESGAGRDPELAAAGESTPGPFPWMAVVVAGGCRGCSPLGLWRA